MALWLPLAVGTWSDRLETPIGSRLPFILAATFPLVLALAVLGFVRSIWLAAIVMAVFFAAYFVAYEPYRALYPDLMDDEIAGRAQSSQAIFRGLGTFLALLGGGLLFSISAPLPFVAAAIIVGAEPHVVHPGGHPPPAPCGAPPRRARRRRREARGRHRPRRPAAAGVPRRQRALGAGARGAQDVRGAVGDEDPRLLAGRLVGRDRGRRGDRARRRAGERPARRQARPRARDALLARALRRRPARPVPHDRDAAAAALRAAGGLRRRRDDVAALRAADADDAPWPARRGDRPVLASAAGWARRSGRCWPASPSRPRARTTGGSGWSAPSQSCSRSRPCAPCTTTDWLVSQ